MQMTTKQRYLPQVDEFACSAHGDCAEIAPDVFRIDDIAVVIGEGSAEEVLEAAEACPAVAITIVDADTGEQVFP
jgi:ferredoxin